MAAAVAQQTDDSKQQAAAAAPKEEKKHKSRRHRHSHHDKKDMRTIGRWYIGQTLGKGGYSWVKKGYDKKTGKCVALKFMAKADESWVAEQSKQVVTEIESLKQIRHPNVMKLYAYNLNARYPTKDEKTQKDKTVDTILLVLEYAPGGELFDILYYTSALEEIVARTYFRQVIAGLEACHNAGVVHRDLKPQNLLLDSRFNIKITDFGLSKLFESDADAQMKTTYVGTRGYQAPELLLDKAYDLSCDIFSIGVVLFILLTGYPPFEQATAGDRWYKSMTKKNYDTFWKAHRASPLANNKECKELLQRMLAYDPKDRISIAEIKKHPWYNGKFLEGKDLIRALRNRHREMEMKRKKDSRKQADLQTSLKKKDIDFAGAVVPPSLPQDVDETVGLLHTTEDWTEFYNTIDAVIGSVGGVAEFDKESMTLNCKMSTANQSKLENIDLFEFSIQVFLSHRFNDDKVKKALETMRQDALKAKAATFDKNKSNSDASDAEQQSSKAIRAQQLKDRKSLKAVYCVRITRIKGDEVKFAVKIKRNFLMLQCGLLFGLPNKRLQSLDQEQGSANAQAATSGTGSAAVSAMGDDDDFVDDDDSDVDYDDLLKNEGFGMDPQKPVAVLEAGGDDQKNDA